MPQYQLTISSEDGETFVRPLGPVTSIGRSEDNHIQILDIKSSRNHCKIEGEGDTWRLVDLESQNGTRVNGKKVNVHSLTDGDEIQIGSTTLRFEAGLAPISGRLTGNGKRKARRDARTAITKTRQRALSTFRKRLREREEDEGLFERLEESLEEIVERMGPEGVEEVFEVVHSITGAELGPLGDGDKPMGLLLRLQEVAKGINSELNLEKLLNLIMDCVLELTGAERGFLVLFQDSEKVSVEVARNIDKESLKRPEFEFSRSIVRQVRESHEPVVSSDAQGDPRFAEHMSVLNLQLRSVLCMPLKTRERLTGVIYIDNRIREGLFAEGDLGVLRAFADQAAIAIENARLWEDNKRKHDELARSKEKVEQLNSLLQEKVENQKVELEEVKETLAHKQSELEFKYNYDQIVGHSKPMAAVFQLLDKVTDTDVPVYVHGESGTGKELVARAIHFNGPRKKERFVSENCAAISETLLESELFGYVKGAFTGADRDKKGLFEIATSGTLFLDEIGEMSQLMQKKLLRVLQEGEIRRVGGKDVIKVDVRIISASNKDLTKLIETGEFREDLYYRINVITVRLPPLRDRREDIPLLVQHFLERQARNQGMPILEVDKEALRMLMNHTWPGNVRELENEITRAAALATGRITPDVLGDAVKGTPARGFDWKDMKGRGLKDVVKEHTDILEKEIIEVTLAETNWVKSEAARRLQISRPTLDAKIDAFQIKIPS